MALKFDCAGCGGEIVVRFLKPGEIAKCRKCGTSAAVPENSSELSPGETEAYLNALLSSADRVVVGTDGTAAEETAPQVKWLRRASLFSLLTAIPSLAYFGLAEIYRDGYPSLPLYLAEALAALFALLLSLLLLKRYNDKDAVGLDIRKLFSLRPFKRTGTVLAASAAADLAVTTVAMVLLIKYFPDDTAEDAIQKLWSGSSNWFFVYFNTIIYASCEEILMRGLIFSYIKQHAGVIKALLVSSLLFTLLHFGDNNWLGLTSIFINGLIYCLAFERTGSLAAPCLVHGLHNSVLRTILILNP